MGLNVPKNLISLNWMLNLGRRFEGTRSLEDRPRSGRPALKAQCMHVIQSVMEDLAADTSTGSSNALGPEKERDSGIVDSKYSAPNVGSVSVQNPRI